MEKLRIYKDDIKLVSKIYFLIKKSPLNKDYSLCDQLKRAAISVPANISEGYKRSIKQNKNCLAIASGSANEVVALLQIISLVYSLETSSLQEDFRLLGRKINAFSKSLAEN